MSAPLQDLPGYAVGMLRRAHELADNLHKQLEQHQSACAQEQHKEEQNTALLILSTQMNTHLGQNQATVDLIAQSQQREQLYHNCWVSAASLKNGMQCLARAFASASDRFNPRAIDWPPELRTDVVLPIGFGRSGSVGEQQVVLCSHVNAVYARIAGAVSQLMVLLNDAKANHLRLIEKYTAELNHVYVHAPLTEEEQRNKIDEINRINNLLTAARSVLSEIAEPMVAIIGELSNHMALCRQRYLDDAVKCI